MTHRFGVPVIDPANPVGPKVNAWFPGDLTLGMYKHESIGYWNLITAKRILENPDLIFEGVREYNKGGWCYVGRPGSWYERPEVTSPFPKGHVYAVYMNPVMYVYQFRAEKADSADPSYPIDWQNRFRRQVWAATS